MDLECNAHAAYQVGYIDAELDSGPAEQGTAGGACTWWWRPATIRTTRGSKLSCPSGESCTDGGDERARISGLLRHVYESQ